jgi:hypothetical protein
MVATGEKMAKFVSQQDGKKRDCERQATEQCCWMLIEEFKSSYEFVYRNGLIVRERHRELRARNEASTQGQQEQEACQR